MKKILKNDLFTNIFVFYSNDLKNQYRSLKYIFLRSWTDTLCNFIDKFEEYRHKNVSDAQENEKNAN